MNVRSKLSGLGKALHKFLSSQPDTYKIRLDKLKITLGYRGQLKHFHPNLKKALNELSRKEWIKEWSITGTGRRTPHVRTSRSRGLLFYRLLEQAVAIDSVTYQQIVRK